MGGLDTYHPLPLISQLKPSCLTHTHLKHTRIQTQHPLLYTKHPLPHTGRRGVSRYPRYQKIFWLAKNFDFYIHILCSAKLFLVVFKCSKSFPLIPQVKQPVREFVTVLSRSIIIIRILCSFSFSPLFFAVKLQFHTYYVITKHS